MTNQHPTEQSQIAALERSFIEACLKRDTQTLDSLLAEEFVFTDPNGVNLTKQEWLADLASGAFSFEALKLEEMQVRIGEDVAMVQASLKVKACSKKAKYEGRYSALDIYEKRGERWQVTLSTANQIKA